MIPFNPAVAAEVRALIQGADDASSESICRELCQVNASASATRLKP
jgi:CCR4-NOT transcription complex subunit 1